MPPSKSTAKAKAPQPRARRKPGRPRAITPEVQDRLTNLLTLGMYVEPACQACGISAATYYKWRAEGEELAVDRRVTQESGGTWKPPAAGSIGQAYLEFYEATERALGGQEAAWLQTIGAAASGGATFTEVKREVEHVRGEDGKVTPRIVGETRTEHVMKPAWQAAAWILERRHPDRWGRRERVELTGRDGGPVESRVNVGAKAVEDETVGLAVDRLLEDALGSS
jgi:transposase